MSNIDGLPVNSAVTHAEFMARTEDTSTTGVVNFNNATDSADTSTGSVTVAGGVGIAKSLNVGENISVSDELIVGGEATFNDTVNCGNVSSDGNINTTADMNALNVNASGVVTALGSVSTPTVNTTTVNTDDLNVANAVTLPSLTTTGGATIGGNLTVNGTTTTVNSATVNTVDPNITLNIGGSDATSEGSGFTVDRVGTKGSFQYQNSLASKFKIGNLASEAEVATVSHAQTLTNKTLTDAEINALVSIEQGSTPLTPAVGKRKLYSKADGFYQLDSTGAETKVGSGSGGGGVQNLIPDGDAESGIINYATGSYSAATRPAGTFTASSGAGSFDISTTTTNPINSTTSFLLTKSSGASRQGRAVERTIVLDQEYRTKVLQMRIKYRVQSGTFVAGSPTTDSSAIFYIGEFNGTTWKYTEPSSFKALSNSTTIVDYVSGTFQVSNDTTQIKLISYVAEAANSAWAIQCEFEISPSVYVYGTPITDWQAYTPIFTGFGTPTSVDFFYRRVGSNLEIRGRFLPSTTTAVEARVSFPSGLISSSLLPALSIAGSGGTARVIPDVLQIFMEPSVSYVTMTAANSAVSGLVKAQGAAFGIVLTSFTASIPIQGWSASTQVSDGFEGRDIRAKYGLTANAAGTANLPLIFTLRSTDTTGSYNTTTGEYIIPSAGFYRVHGLLQNASASLAVNYQLRKNGVNINDVGSGVNYICSVPAASSLIPFIGGANYAAGDRLTIVPDGVTQQMGTNSYIIIEKVNAGSQTISATDKIRAKYGHNTGQSIPNSAVTTLLPTVKKYDTHGVFNTGTGEIRLPRPGFGEIKFSVLYVSASIGIGYLNTATVYKNGVFYANLDYRFFNTSTGETGCSGSCDIEGVTGDLFTVRVLQNRGSARATYTGSADSEYTFIDFSME